jgi:hypothetical protein
MEGLNWVLKPSKSPGIILPSVFTSTATVATFWAERGTVTGAKTSADRSMNLQKLIAFSSLFEKRGIRREDQLSAY